MAKWRSHTGSCQTASLKLTLRSVQQVPGHNLSHNLCGTGWVFPRSFYSVKLYTRQWMVEGSRYTVHRSMEVESLRGCRKRVTAGPMFSLAPNKKRIFSPKSFINPEVPSPQPWQAKNTASRNIVGTKWSFWILYCWAWSPQAGIQNYLWFLTQAPKQGSDPSQSTLPRDKERGGAH